LKEGLIRPALVNQMCSWRHSGFHVDRSVHLDRGDRKGIEQLARYMARCPFSLARLVRITGEGKVLYKADKEHCQHYPAPASDDLYNGVDRNYQIFEPLDFLAELTQHIPDKGEHLIRYYGCYSNKCRAKAGNPPATSAFPATPTASTDQGVPGSPASKPPAASPGDRQARRRWAVLIQRVYQADPLRCPHCGGAMQIIAFIEAHGGGRTRSCAKSSSTAACGIPRPHVPALQRGPRLHPFLVLRSPEVAPACTISRKPTRNSSNISTAGPKPRPRPRWNCRGTTEKADQ
jgi:hypothetical protein